MRRHRHRGAALLRASHTKPWADCETDAERLDVYNGILLAPHLDAAFDQGFITVADDGTIVVSDALGADARTVLGLDCAFAASPTVIEPICRGTANACSSTSRRTS
jgi:hypothetical protein